jgi:hypothetical protein
VLSLLLGGTYLLVFSDRFNLLEPWYLITSNALRVVMIIVHILFGYMSFFINVRKSYSNILFFIN